MAKPAITSASWNDDGGYDLHLIRGTTSSQLFDDILITLIGSTAKVSINTVNFPYVDDTPTTWGIRVHSHISATAKAGIVFSISDMSFTALSDESKYDEVYKSFSFIVDISLLKNGIVFGVPLSSRVYVHGAIDEIWLTPTDLNIPTTETYPWYQANFSLDPYRFSVHAKFDDGSIGDISRLNEIKVSASGAKQKAYTWKSLTPSEVDVDAATGALDGKVTGASSVAIELRSSSLLGNLPAVGTVNVTPAWSELPNTLERIPGSASSAPDENVNVLFLPDGFKSSEQEEFNDLVVKIVAKLRDGPSPYDLLKESFNYWRAFIPSEDSDEGTGTTVLNDLNVVTKKNGALIGKEIKKIIYSKIDDSNKSEKTDVFKSLKGLVTYLGLPFPTDSSITKQKLLERSKKTSAAGMFNLSISNNKFKQWRKLISHNVVTERNTILGMATGGHSRLVKEQLPRVIGFHPFRAKREHLDRFLSKLKIKINGVDVNVGKHWMVRQDDTVVSNDIADGINSKRGKDSDHVVILSKGARYSGTFYPDDAQKYLCIGLSNGKSDVMLKQESLGRVSTIPNPLPIKKGKISIPIFLHYTIAHELMHSFKLKDEYGGDRFKYTGAATNYPNAQEKKSLLNIAAPNIGEINGDKIKWRWPRLKAAGIILNEPIPIALNAGGVNPERGFRLLIDREHIGNFDELKTIFTNESPVVYLRIRDFKNFTPEQYKITSSPFKLKIVDKLSATVDIVQSTSLPAIDPKDFPKGSLLVAPLFPTNMLNLDPFLEVMAKDVRDHISTSKRPLNVKRGKKKAKCKHNTSVNRGNFQRPRNLPRLIKNRLGKKVSKSHIVGLYEGGLSYSCDVYHPTGWCNMRKGKNGAEVVSFCHVCKYHLVDIIDPSKHADIDLDYAKFYPEKVP